LSRRGIKTDDSERQQSSLVSLKPKASVLI